MTESIAMTRYSSVHSAPPTNVTLEPAAAAEEHDPIEEQQQQREEGFSHFIAICFTVNYLIGTGFLTIPWAFERGGIVLSLFTLIIVVVVSNITKNYLLSSMALAESLTRLGQVETEENSNGISQTVKHENGYGAANQVESNSLESNGSEDGGLENQTGETYQSVEEHEQEEEELALVRERKFEVIDLCRMYLGEIGEKLLIVSVALDVYFELWAFVSVFASSTAREMPLAKNFDGDYVVYAILFAIIVVPLSCLELREQVEFQITLSACRMVVILIMIATSYAAIRNDRQGGTDIYFTGVDGIQGAPMVHFGGFYAMFSVMFYTTQFHLSIPVVSQAVRDKRQLGGVFRDALVIVATALAFLGLIVAWFFGDLVEQSTNLNWSTFVGGISSETDPVPWWARAISLFVLCFPALNVLSAYPINAILLGNNLLAITYGTNDTAHRNNRFIRVVFRILASVPPIIGALFVKELGTITDYAGLFGAVSALPFPAVVFLVSRKMATERGLPKTTYYDSFGSSERFAVGVFILSMVALVYILLSLILS